MKLVVLTVLLSAILCKSAHTSSKATTSTPATPKPRFDEQCKLLVKFAALTDATLFKSTIQTCSITQDLVGAKVVVGVLLVDGTTVKTVTGVIATWGTKPVVTVA